MATTSIFQYIYKWGGCVRALTSWSTFCQAASCSFASLMLEEKSVTDSRSFICTRTTKCQTNVSKQFLFPGIPVQYLCPVPRSQHKSRKDSKIKTQKDFLLLTEFQNGSLQSWIIPNELSAQHTSPKTEHLHTHTKWKNGKNWLLVI